MLFVSGSRGKNLTVKFHVYFSANARGPDRIHAGVPLRAQRLLHKHCSHQGVLNEM